MTAHEASSESGISVRVSWQSPQPAQPILPSIAAYFSQQKLDRLDTIDNVKGIGDVPVPDGWFRSARRDGKSRRDDDLPKSVVAKRMSQAPMEGVISTSDSAQSSFYRSQPPAPAYTQFPTSTNTSQLELSEAPGARKPTFSLPSSAEHPHYTSSGVRQTTYSEPNLTSGRDHPRFRDSIPAHPSYSCPSPPSSSSSMPATPSPRLPVAPLTDQLVPLDYLQNLSYPRRDPIDEQFLQRFSTQTLTSTMPKGAPFVGHSHSHSFSGRMQF